MIRICVDSNSQLPRVLAERFGIAVVPVVVTVDGVEYHEGVDLDADAFYATWTEDHEPVVSTSQPPPGDFATAYAALVEDGATEILSVHVGESWSGTINSARLAAAEASVPVRLVDSGNASFGISCCAWAAAEAVLEGADLETAARTAEERAAHLGTAFVVGVPQLAEQSGRATKAGIAAAAETGIPVVAMSGGEVEVLASVTSTHAAVVAMRDYALGWTPSMIGGLRVAIGTSDLGSAPVARLLTEVLEGHGDVADIVQYRIGPSIGAYTGPGTAGLFVF